MHITPVMSYRNQIAPQIQAQRLNYGNNNACDCVCFTALTSEAVKPIREALADPNITPKKIGALFSSIPVEYQQRVIEIADALKLFGVDRNIVFRKFVKQPSIATSTAEAVINRIKAHAFVERHKSAHPREDMIPYVIDSKNLGKSLSSIYMPLLISQIFASGKRPDCFVDESGLENTFKRYCRKEPDAKFDKVEVLEDEMTDSFIEFTKRLSRDIKGTDDLFDVSVKKEIEHDNAPKPLSTDKFPTIKELLAHLKYQFYETSDKEEMSWIYDMLPERYHENFSDLLATLKRMGEKVSEDDLFPLFLKNNFFFNMKADDSVNLIQAKKFIDKSNGKNEGTIKEVLETAYFPALYPDIYYSHFLASKMFPEKTKRPWYLKQAANVDLTDGIQAYLRENPQYKLEFDVKQDDKAEEFYSYAKELSCKSIGRNAFSINIVE